MFQNAITALNYEKNQLKNFMKQYTRLGNHRNIANGKYKKKDDFLNISSQILLAIGALFTLILYAFSPLVL